MLLNYFHKDLREAGCDEVGRGCLAGPVFAAAVILPHDFSHELINDSKKITAKQRDYLYNVIIEHAERYAVASVDERVIDDINILKATHLAMHKAIDQLVDACPEHLLIDGNSFPPYLNIPHTCVIQGDGKYISIAAASIIAKVTRDRYMDHLHEQFPMYHWNKNKGYGTKAHVAAIREFGLTPHHRLSFKLKSNLN